jgi:CMP-N-acetylneuraminic acid synthetase|tara:strand:+ start:207 stop:524 length:318 start_codon:yes stop_codon:yes gene_type:complete
MTKVTKFSKAIDATRPVFANQPSHDTLKNSPAEKGAYEQLIQQVMDVNATYRSNAALYIKRAYAFLAEDAAAGSELDVEFTPEQPAVSFDSDMDTDVEFESAVAA